MVPMLNHSLFMNINNKITNVILDIVIEIGLDITILLYLNSVEGSGIIVATSKFGLIWPLRSPHNLRYLKIEFILYSGV